MKKILLKIAINLIVIVLMFLVFDFSVFYAETSKYMHWDKFIHSINTYKSFYLRNPDKKFLYEHYILGKNNFFKRTVNKNSNKKPIVLFGCSYVHGYKIPEESIFSEVLGRYTKRPIYNRAWNGNSVQHMLYQLENDDFYKIIPQPEFVIYTFINPHIFRLYLPCSSTIKENYDIFYKKSKDTVILKDNNIVKKGFVSIHKLKELLYFKGLYGGTQKEREDFLKRHLLKAKKYVDENWPGTKFVILNYNKPEYSDNLDSALKQAGFIIINREEIAPFENNLQYSISETDSHPNEHAWEYIVPKLVKELEKY